MCFSERVSWTTLAASWTGCAAMASTGQPHLQAMAGFLALVGGMQLWEALLWRNTGCTPTNGALSDAGAINNHLEPVALYAMSALLLTPRSPAKARLAAVVMAAYVAVFATLTVGFLRRPLERRCTRLTDHGLAWQWNDYGKATDPAYLLFLAAFVTTTYAYMPPGFDHTMVAVTVSSFAISSAIYGRRGMTGSMWCFFAALVPWLSFAM